MAGDAADAGSVWQGWPASMVAAADEYSLTPVPSSLSGGSRRRRWPRSGGRPSGEDDDEVEMLERARGSGSQLAEP